MATPKLDPIGALDLAKKLGYDGVDFVSQANYNCGLEPTATLDEARALAARSGEAPAGRLPIGYPEALAVVRGELPVEEAIRRVQAAHRQYAKRQLTWLRGERGVTWLAPPYDVEALARRVER